MRKFTTQKGVCLILQRKWKIIDTVIAVLLTITLIGFVLFSIVFSSFFIGNKQTAEVPISGKISEKGLYFSPLYKVTTEDYGNSYIFKQQFYDLNPGDELSGYQTDQIPFFTTADIIYDGALSITFLLILGILAFLFISYFYREFFKKTKNNDVNFNTRKKRWGNIVNISIIVYIVLSFSFLLLVFSNLYHQVTPFGQTHVEANIVDTEIKKRYGRYVTDDFYLYITYKDKDEQEYLVKKQVNYHIYNTYKNYYGIPIHYPTNNPANAFIQLQSLEDYSTALISFQTLLIGSILYSYSYIYGRFKRQKDSSAHK